VFNSRNLLSGKRKYVLGLLFLSFICVISAAFSIEDSDDFDFARREVLLRRIEYEILLQSGNSISRVLPVKKLHNLSNNYTKILVRKTFFLSLAMQHIQGISRYKRLVASH
jgi:hypothetical protein